ncbi:hypothetical protein AMTR_s00085p00117900 [Amborella trichopoda]|uniref:PB1 domain-containing protein n=1 Tax=Amborella trichopoda TaxID=13333 RepID=W1P6V8_AMBTC|nr:hypothetical protein AMTR_s00085p00117900 [Amborella trichopoda]
MGKPSGKKKNYSQSNSGDASMKQHKASDLNSKTIDEDMIVFILRSQELKEEGNKLSRRENTLKPVSPKYTKALLKRAKCYEALTRLDLALRDVNIVLSLEPKNLTALEIAERLKQALQKKGFPPDNISTKNVVEPVSQRTQVKISKENVIEPVTQQPQVKGSKEKSRKKKISKIEDKIIVEETDNAIVEENVKVEPIRAVKLVLGEDIRWGQVPVNCNIKQLREMVRNRFPCSKAVLIKYRDVEGDLVTITTTEELRWAEESADPQGSLRLYIFDVSPDQEPLFEDANNESESLKPKEAAKENGVLASDKAPHIDDWIVQFARLFKSHVGFDSEAYLHLHDIGMKLYSEAMEDTVTSEEAQGLFEIAAEKFQEMAALALFNWGNVHMSRAKRRVSYGEVVPRELILSHIKNGYEWAQREYNKAGERYEEALRIKPDFYEGFLAHGQQQFEQAKLGWDFALGSHVDLETWPSSEVLQLFNNAEDNMERGTNMWEEMEEKRLNDPKIKGKTETQKIGENGVTKELSPEEAVELVANMRSQINLLWGTMLYERSVIEFKLGLQVWDECLEAAVEKFKHAGASPTDIAVMIKNHPSNSTALEGLNFKIDEIVQAWNEMYDAKRWLKGVPSFRLEPLFRRRVPKLHRVLEHV